MYRVWVIDGEIASFTNSDTQALAFSCKTQNDMMILIKMAEKEGYSIGIEITEE